MRVLHLADPHIELRGRRAEECRRILDYTALHARDVAPNVIVLAGDVFDRRSTPEERIYFAEFLGGLSSTAPVVLIGGNHDDREDLALFRREYGWTLPVEVVLKPDILEVGGLVLACLPWPDLSRLVRTGASIADRREAAKAALLDIVRGFRAELRSRGGPSLLVAHLPVAGASMDSGQPVCGGDEIALTADELLESGAAGVALGHIHLRQAMDSASGRPVLYAGAPFRGSFGEAKGDKGGLLWDWNPPVGWAVSAWDLPARPMILLEAVWEHGRGTIIEYDDDVVRGAEVRLRITVPTDDRETMRASVAPAIARLQGLAETLRFEEIPVAEAHVRCAEIVEARTVFDKVKSWAAAVGADVPEDAEEKIRELELGAEK